MQSLIISAAGTVLIAFFLALGAHAGGGAERSDGRYVNSTGPQPMKFVKAASQVLFSQQNDKTPSEPLPLRRIDVTALAAAEGPLLYRLGHSSILLKLGGDYVLIDPVFSERASPLQWLGPRRFHPVPLDTDELPNITAVVISHNHYDHLDALTVRKLAPKVQRFIVPLGVGAHLESWAIAAGSIVELDWWESFELGEPVNVLAPRPTLAWWREVGRDAPEEQVAGDGTRASSCGETC